ncbi:calcium-binding protein [Mesorhizobium sp. ASY16-5R]|uniref:calcium-binding protein n=1 Tax=Mesorhizobium sp. ASY16-5R TaxID=3445772 RepID=UPI003F9FB36E
MVTNVTFAEDDPLFEIARFSESSSSNPSRINITGLPSGGELWYRPSWTNQLVQITTPISFYEGQSNLTLDSVAIFFRPYADFAGYAGRLAVNEFTSNTTPSTRYFEYDINVTSSPDAPRDIVLSGYTVAENDPGAGVGVITAVDPDAGDYSNFALVGDVSGKFEVLSGTLRLRQGEQLDFEQQASYVVRLRAVDSTGRAYERDLTLQVTDVFEGPDLPTQGADLVYGTADGDVIAALGGSDVVYGLGGNDQISGDAGNDYISGGTGDDTLSGSSGIDTLIGGDGVDRLDGGTGADALEGGADSDVYLVDNAGDVITEEVGFGSADRVMARASYTLESGVEVELLTTAASSATTAINLTGNSLHQEIVGNAGENVLKSGAGLPDLLKGRGGNDTYAVYNSGDIIVEAASEGSNDKVAAAVSYVLASSVHIEQMATTSAGGTSPISLTGNGLAQTITGNAGANRLEGKGGSDSLRGLGGNDTFVFASTLGANNVDTILDFNPTDDRFLLSDNVFTSLSTGTLSASAFRANMTGLAEDGTDRIIFNTTTGEIFYDGNGSAAGEGVLFAKVTVGLSLTHSDFSIA